MRVETQDYRAATTPTCRPRRRPPAAHADVPLGPASEQRVLHVTPGDFDLTSNSANFGPGTSSPIREVVGGQRPGVQHHRRLRGGQERRQPHHRPQPEGKIALLIDRGSCTSSPSVHAQDSGRHRRHHRQQPDRRYALAWANGAPMSTGAPTALHHHQRRRQDPRADAGGPGDAAPRPRDISTATPASTPPWSPTSGAYTAPPPRRLRAAPVRGHERGLGRLQRPDDGVPRGRQPRRCPTRWPSTCRWPPVPGYFGIRRYPH